MEYEPEESLRQQLDKWHQRALDAQYRAGPGDAVLKEIRLLARCPMCSHDHAWKERVCCRLGVAVGEWETRAVADILMQKDS
jgi:hypothetical protein